MLADQESDKLRCGFRPDKTANSHGPHDMELRSPDMLDLGRFEFTDWRAARRASADGGPLQNINSRNIEPNKFVLGVRDNEESGIEWRFSPPQHVGAMSPQLLYRSTEKTLSNSFLTIMPPATTVGDIDIVARVFSPQARHQNMLHVYQGWVVARLTSLHSPNGYMAAIYRNNADTTDVGSIWRLKDGARTFKLAAASLGSRVDWAKPWHCRFSLSGSALKAKWWNYDVIEPVTWDLQTTDNDIVREGMLGFAATVHGGISDNIWGLDWYAWSRNPEQPAPLYPYEPEM